MSSHISRDDGQSSPSVPLHDRPSPSDSALPIKSLPAASMSMTEEQLERWRKIWAADLLFERIATEDMEQTFQ